MWGVWGRTVFFWVERRLGGAFGWDACGGAAEGVGHAGGGARSVAGPWLGLCWAPACRQRGPRLHATCAASAAGRAGVCDWERAGVCGWESWRLRLGELLCSTANQHGTGRGGARGQRAGHPPSRASPTRKRRIGPRCVQKTYSQQTAKRDKTTHALMCTGPGGQPHRAASHRDKKKDKGKAQKKDGQAATAA